MRTMITQEEIRGLLRSDLGRTTAEVLQLAQESYGETTRSAIWQHLSRLLEAGEVVKTKAGVESCWRKTAKPEAQPDQEVA